jgi:hypothetical protein
MWQGFLTIKLDKSKSLSRAPLGSDLPASRIPSRSSITAPILPTKTRPFSIVVISPGEYCLRILQIACYSRVSLLPSRFQAKNCQRLSFTNLLHCKSSELSNVLPVSSCLITRIHHALLEVLFDNVDLGFGVVHPPGTLPLGWLRHSRWCLTQSQLASSGSSRLSRLLRRGQGSWPNRRRGR